MKIEILPSLLAADLGRLAEETRRAEASGADALHIDIMDPHFVPNMSFGPSIVDFCRKTCPTFYRNVHLMMSRPDLYIQMFADSGAQTIQVHFESDCDLHEQLRRIRSMGVKNAIVINPETPAEVLIPYLRQIEYVVVMGVHPGYSGQKYIPETTEKVAVLAEMIAGAEADCFIQVDGGVSTANIAELERLGAGVFVAGSATFSSDDPLSAIKALKTV